MRIATTVMSALLGVTSSETREPSEAVYQTTSSPTPYSWTKGIAGRVRE